MKNCFTLIILTLLSTSLNALIIDDFNGSNQSVLSSNTMNVSETVAYANAFGGFRTITVFPPNGSFGTEGKVSFGVYAFNAGVSTLGASTVTWSNAVGIDIMEAGINNTFTFETLGVSPDMVDIILSVTDGMNTTNSVAVISVTDGLQHIAFSAFPNVDFTNITNISLMVEGINPAADFALDILQTTSQISIPEPTSLLLFGMGLSWLGFGRSRVV